MPHRLPHRPLPIYHYLIHFQLVPGSGLFYEETNVVQEYSFSIEILPLPQPFPGRIIDRSTKGFTYLHQQHAQSIARPIWSGFFAMASMSSRSWLKSKSTATTSATSETKSKRSSSNLINTSISGAATPKTTSLATSLSDRGPRARGSGGAWSMRDRDTLSLTSRLAVDCRKIILHCSHMSTDVNSYT